MKTSALWVITDGWMDEWMGANTCRRHCAFDILDNLTKQSKQQQHMFQMTVY